MKRLITLLLVIALMITSASVLISCRADGNDTDTGTQNNGGANNDGENNGTEGNTPELPTIRVPEYKDYGRGTVDFTELSYARPDIAAVIEAFDAVTAAIKANEIPFEDQVEMIVGLEAGYNNYLTMRTLAEIYNSKDTSNEFWRGEYDYVTTNYSSFAQAIEDMYVAAAQSEHKARFEEEYFSESIDEYVDGGTYTDLLVELLAKEAELENEYSSMSPGTVVITTMDGQSGTVTELLAKVPESELLAKTVYYNGLYKAEYNRLAAGIYTELVKTRVLIAEEMGYDSYINVSYENMGHDYTPQQMMSFLADIRDITDEFNALYYELFKYTYYATPMAKSNHIDVINTLYELYLETDEDLADIYAYMLQHGLFDIETSGGTRLDASFTTYIDSNRSPFVFVSASGSFEDYATLSHEFGHFVDFYVNDGDSASLDLSEVYSQALEYLSMLKLEDKMSGNAETHRSYLYLLHSEIDAIYSILMYQGFLAAYEHLVYSLDYNEVTEEKLNSLIAEAQKYAWGYAFEGEEAWKMDSVIILHTVEYPFYVQSYCTSLVAAIEIMLLESEEDGSGLEAFKLLVSRGDCEDLSFEDQLFRAGIESPFRDGALDSMAKRIYYFIRGYEFGSTSSGSNVA